MKKYILFFFFIVFLIGCKDDDDAGPIIPNEDEEFAAPFTGVAAVKDRVIYEVNLRAFSNAGDLKGVQARLDSIKALGVNVIWLMPIHPVGQVRSAGGLGSPYSVMNYKAVNPEFGTITDMQNFVKAAHDRQMAVVIDWVANHTSWDHAWISSHPEWYTQDGSGNIIIPAGTNWQDVADLNFENAEMRKEMIKSMKYWILRANIDGFRCDAADLVPFDFWTQAIDTFETMTHRNIILLAEGSRGDHFTAGFQMNYGWDFYGAAKNVFRTGATANTLPNANITENNTVPATAAKLRFTTNHDESAWDASPITLFGGKRGAMSAFVITAYMGGVPMIYNGQEVGREETTPFFTKSPINWAANPEYFAEYKQVMAFRQSSATVRQGTIEYFAHSDVVGFRKKLNGDEVVVLANTRNSVINYTLAPAIANTTWKNALTGADVALGTALTLQAYEYLILRK